MDELVSQDKGFAPGFFFGLIVGAFVLFVACLIVVDQRDELARQLERANIRLEEARKLCGSARCTSSQGKWWNPEL